MRAVGLLFVCGLNRIVSRKSRVNVALAFAAFGIVERLDRFPQVRGLYVAVRVEGHAFGGGVPQSVFGPKTLHGALSCLRMFRHYFIGKSP